MPVRYSISAGSLPPGLQLDSSTGVVSGTPTSVGSFLFTIRVRDSASPAGDVTRPFTIQVAAAGPTDLAVGLVADPSPATADDVLTYTLGISNVGAAAAVGVKSTLTLPAGVTFISARGPGACSHTGALVVCDIGALLASGSVDIAVLVHADVGGVTLVANAYIESTSPDSDPANNNATVTPAVSGAGTRRLFIADEGIPGGISVIDPDTDTSLGTIDLAAPADDVTFSPDGQRAYVVNTTLDSVAILDTVSNTVIATLGVTSPVHLAVSSDGSRVYVVGAPDAVWIFDAVSNALITTITVGSTPSGVAVSPDDGRVYVANAGGDNVSVIDTLTNTVVATVPVGEFPIAVALAPNGKRVYVANYFANSVSVIDAETNTVTATIPVDAGPQGLAVGPDGRRVYVANFDDNTVSVIDETTNSVVASPTVPGSPIGITVSPDGDRVFITARNAGLLRVLDTATNAISLGALIPAGSLPVAVAYVRLPDIPATLVPVLVPDVAVSAAVNSPGETALYTFTLATTEHVILQATQTGVGGAIAPCLHLATRPGGPPLPGGSSCGFPEARLDVVLAPGKYFVEVSDSVNNTGAYTLLYGLS